MKVNVVLKVYSGIIDDVEVYVDPEQADAALLKWLQKNGAITEGQTFGDWQEMREDGEAPMDFEDSTIFVTNIIE